MQEDSGQTEEKNLLHSIYLTMEFTHCQQCLKGQAIWMILTGNFTTLWRMRLTIEVKY